ncbi:MAG: hypothetical protein M1114_06200 [Candidatus Dependentiae bacterium]|nr:hypothetical protein [Candidatus Dependentiae bacterium]
MNNNHFYESLVPHKYPLWIKIGSIICFFLFCASLTYFPYYLKLNDKCRAANASFAKEDYYQASILYAELSELLPQHKNIQLRRVQALFKSTDRDDHAQALELLSSVKLKKDEWKELLAYMPHEYETLFRTTLV